MGNSPTPCLPNNQHKNQVMFIQILNKISMSKQLATILVQVLNLIFLASLELFYKDKTVLGNVESYKHLLKIIKINARAYKTDIKNSQSNHIE